MSALPRRRLTPGSFAALAVAVATALGVAVTASGCQDSVAAPGVGDAAQTREALDLLPPDATMIGMVDLGAARASDAVATATGGAGLGLMSPGRSADFDAFVRQTGFNPGEDLDRIYVASTGGEAQGAFVAYGRFSRERLEAYLADRPADDGPALVATDIGGVPAYLAADDAGHRHGIALPNDRMILAGDEATLTAMLGRLGGTAAQPAPAMQALLDRVVYPDGAWFVARDLESVAGEGDGPLGVAGAQVRALVLSMDFQRDGVAVRAFAEPAAPATPDALADVMRGGVAAARMGVKDEPAALDVLDGVRVTSASDGVDVQALLTPAFLAAMHHERAMPTE